MRNVRAAVSRPIGVSVRRCTSSTKSPDQLTEHDVDAIWANDDVDDGGGPSRGIRPTTPLCLLHGCARARSEDLRAQTRIHLFGE